MTSTPSLAQVQSDLFSGITTCRKLVLGFLKNIYATQDLNAYIEIYDKEALTLADILDAKVKKKKDLGRCFGLIISVKDVICQKGKKVSAASKILQGFESLYTATALQRLLDEDAIVIGRTNCDQFGMGSSNENSIYGPVKNADQPTQVPGGSSGGSAVSVQANTCMVALGSDTGGSVRQPAGFTGVYGLKPSYGTISRYGLIAYASSFDQIGLLGKHLSDLKLALEIMSGTDPMDPTTLDSTLQDTIKIETGSAKKIAYFGSAIDHKGLDLEIKVALENLISHLNEEGHACEKVTFDLLDVVVPAYYILTTAEASSNLARFDAVRYGHRSDKEGTLEDMYADSRTEGFSEEVKRRIILGTFVLSSGYYDAYYCKAQKIRAMIKDQLDQLFKQYDFILLPTSPVPAWEIGAERNDPTEMYLADIFTVLANLAGIPTIAIPLGTHSNGTKFGYQLMGPNRSEVKLISFAKALKI